MDETRPPVYVSSVTYGRMVVFTFESEYSAEEMGAALEFAYSGGVDVSGDVSVTYKDIISKSKITAFILGGDAGTAVQTIDSYEALIDVHQERRQLLARVAGRADRLQAGLPEGQLAGADVVHDRLRGQGRASACRRRSGSTLNAIAVDDAGGDAGDDLEIYGRIWVEGTNSATLFDRNSDNWVRIREGQQFGAGQPIAEAVINVSPQGRRDDPAARGPPRGRRLPQRRRRARQRDRRPTRSRPAGARSRP